MRARAAGAVCGVVLAVASCGGSSTGVTAAPVNVSGTWHVATLNNQPLPFQLGSYSDSVANCAIVLDSMWYAFGADSLRVSSFHHDACVAVAPPNDTTLTPSAYTLAYLYQQSGNTLYLTASAGTSVDTVAASLSVGYLTLRYLYGGNAGSVVQLHR